MTLSDLAKYSVTTSTRGLSATAELLVVSLLLTGFYLIVHCRSYFYVSRLIMVMIMIMIMIMTMISQNN